MADSQREKIVQQVDSRFKAVKVTNGYETDFGLRAFRWRVTDFQDSELPCFNFRDTECVTEQHLSNVHLHTLKIECIAVHKKPVDMDADKYGRKMLADMWKAVGVDRRWGTFAIDTNPVRDELSLEHEDRLLVAAKVEFEIKYRTTSFSPYTQV